MYSCFPLAEVALGRTWAALGVPGRPSGPPGPRIGLQKQKVVFYLHKTLSWDTPPDPPDPGNLPEMVSSGAGPTLGSTRAEGQDDGS